MESVVLASASPRRRELLDQLGVRFTARAADIDESVRPDEAPVAYVLRLAQDKAAAVGAAAAEDAVVIAADTTVDVDGRILGKPRDAADARAMLTALAARDHHVHTAVTVRRGRDVASAVVTTVVRFAALTPADVDWYLSTGEPFDKAGAYAIQGAGGALVARVEGSVSNVVGLPLVELLELTRRLGVHLLTPLP